eukprot:TRINITY_DN4628_c3_g1_i2.p1 TRINITY_DN4628_c3_g1~~TRINITY_DN4628_c3_g1_i2.p1  ORF type:complete len:822 (+),score=191.08 TRINITY_DN4628_c3_g1_i2:103-2568(+)
MLAVAPLLAAAAGAGQLRARYWSNAHMLTEPACVRSEPLPLNASADADLPCGMTLDLVTVRWDGALILPADGTYRIGFVSSGPVRVFVNEWRLVDGDGKGNFGSPNGTLWHSQSLEFFNATAGTQYPIRVDFLSAGGPAFAQLVWKVNESGGFVEVPASALSPVVADTELKRQALQTEYARSWSTWGRRSSIAYVHPPSGAAVALSLMNTTSGSVWSVWHVDKCTGGSAVGCQVFYDAHTNRGEYTSMTYLPVKYDSSVKLLFETGHGNTSESMVLKVSGGTAEDLVLVADITFGTEYFNCYTPDGAPSYCGSVKVDAAAGTFEAAPTGLPVVSGVFTGCYSAPSSQAGRMLMRFDSAGEVRMAVTVGTTASAAEMLTQVTDVIAARRGEYSASLDSRYPVSKVGQDLRDGVEAIRAAVGWNTMYSPSLGVITPVGRNFGPQPWAVWLWDTYFLTLLAAESDRDLAYSNLFEVTRTTVLGNVPGMRWGNTMSNPADRSKPYVGPMVIRQLYSKFGDKWVVEKVMPQLLEWADWVHDHRRFGAENLIVLGSDRVPKGWSDGNQCTFKAAKWESGLDNSPMYDDQGQWDGDACRVKLYDVGMTGLYINFLDDLGYLAGVVGMDSVVEKMKERRDAMAAPVDRVFWNSSHGMYLNRRSDTGAVSVEVSPFNFHMMLAGIPSEDQVTSMIRKWLLPSTGFCLNETTPPSVTSAPHCNHPLPSIAASDPEFGGSYWRGRVWGPMNYLVYKGLRHERYAEMPLVAESRKLLAAKSLRILLKQWRTKRHVHENYNATNADGDDVPNSNPFYHWGALLALIGVQEQGLY